MRRLMRAGWAILLVMLLLTVVLPSVVTAEMQAGATPMPEPTTLGQLSAKTSPTMSFMLIGALVVGCGAMLIFLRYK